MKPIVILHHFEPMWETALKRLTGADFDQYQENVCFHLEELGLLDASLIITRFEDFEVDKRHFDFFHENAVVHEYGYGWDEEMKDSILEYNDDVEFCKGGVHSEWVLIPQWLKDIKKQIDRWQSNNKNKQECKVLLGGCFDGECIEDMEIALRHCQIEYKRLEEIIH